MCQVAGADIEGAESNSDPESGGEERLLTTPVGVARLRLGAGPAAPDSHTPTLCEYSSTPDYRGGQSQ